MFSLSSAFSSKSSGSSSAKQRHHRGSHRISPRWPRPPQLPGRRRGGTWEKGPWRQGRSNSRPKMAAKNQKGVVDGRRLFQDPGSVSPWSVKTCAVKTVSIRILIASLAPWSPSFWGAYCCSQRLYYPDYPISYYTCLVGIGLQGRCQVLVPINPTRNGPVWLWFTGIELDVAMFPLKSGWVFHSHALLLLNSIFFFHHIL